MDVATNYKKHIITNEREWIRQFVFSGVTFFSTAEFSVVFNISYSHAHILIFTNLFTK